MPVSGQTYLDVIFASGGSTTAIPDGVQGDGSVSFTQGYGSNYTLPQGSPGSLNVEEVKMNYLFNLITSVLQTYQQQTIAPWIPAAATSTGSAYPYSKYSLALYTNGIAYISLVNSNTVLPGSDATKWQPITLGTGLLASNNLSDVASLSTAQTNLGFVESLSNSGYQKLPGNLIIQWGENVCSGSSVTVTLPITFPNAAFMGICSDGGSGAYSGGAAATTTQITLYKQGGIGSSVTYNWIAFGY